MCFHTNNHILYWNVCMTILFYLFPFIRLQCSSCCNKWYTHTHTKWNLSRQDQALDWRADFHIGSHGHPPFFSFAYYFYSEYMLFASHSHIHVEHFHLFAKIWQFFAVAFVVVDSLRSHATLTLYMENSENTHNRTRLLANVFVHTHTIVHMSHKLLLIRNMCKSLSTCTTRKNVDSISAWHSVQNFFKLPKYGICIQLT